ncbi:hypothetical protein [Algisphaera agarilytica]|uniref:Uncharacterized protein n=1 Tax=Algisphaera agarilytica TaxID=1385975 RepID=A0A7X0LKZ1_9BACT|nr:hypothetical protein [Algisphaera agarilytica]MBB6430950.1 hypothetical protein [Algisphaera agarilytica]
MKVESFLEHHGLIENPFAAEEARLDAVFNRLADSSLHHPDINKIFGTLDQPSTAVVFGEKGSGKTAIRLTMQRKISEHNANVLEVDDHRRVLAVSYDDFNPVLDKLSRANKKDTSEIIRNFRLADHQDAILTEAATKLVNALLNEGTTAGDEAMSLPNEKISKLRKRLTQQQRLDLAVLAGLYDQPPSGIVIPRWRKLRKTLRLKWRLPIAFWRNAAIFVTLVTAGLGGWYAWLDYSKTVDETTGAVTGAPASWMIPVLGLVAAGTIALWVTWAVQFMRTWGLARKVAKEMPAIGRNTATLRGVFGELGVSTLVGQPLPAAGKDAAEQRDSRYQLTRRFVDVLKALGYSGMVVLVDRVDEPTAVAGDAGKMRDLIWPMFDNKFLKQDGIGLKLLLPIELSYLLNKESPSFFQEARLDKQNMIDKLTWSGATLYDLCSSRLNACKTASKTGELSLTDFFEESVTRETLIDALDQMHQPRDAFKFLYNVVQEHCRLLPEDTADYHINRLTLETVRRTQSQRVQELYRGLTPA